MDYSLQHDAPPPLSSCDSFSNGHCYLRPPHWASRAGTQDADNALKNQTDVVESRKSDASHKMCRHDGLRRLDRYGGGEVH